jgi:hypothetical protein
VGTPVSRNSNDDRSDSMNPNNDAYHSSMDNHANQYNPNNHAYDDRMNNHSNQMNPNNDAYQDSSDQINPNNGMYRGYCDDQEYSGYGRSEYYSRSSNPSGDHYLLEIENMLCDEFNIKKSQLVSRLNPGPHDVIGSGFSYRGLVLYPHIPAGVLRLNIAHGADAAGLMIDYHGLNLLYRFDTHKSFYRQRVLLHIDHLRRKFTTKNIANYLDDNLNPGNRYGFILTIEEEKDMYLRVVNECQYVTDEEMKNMQLYLGSLQCLQTMLWDFNGDPNQWRKEYSENYKEILTGS